MQKQSQIAVQLQSLFGLNSKYFYLLALFCDCTELLGIWSEMLLKLVASPFQLFIIQMFPVFFYILMKTPVISVLLESLLLTLWGAFNLLDLDVFYNTKLLLSAEKTVAYLYCLIIIALSTV